MAAKKKSKRLNSLLLLLGMSLVLYALVVFFTRSKALNGSVQGIGTGFDQYGYNDTARIFNGTGSSWCLARGAAADCMGIYSPDKLVMKWTADWDRGNAENWANPPYDKAWLDNEWNGSVKGGSGAVWHYKTKWIGPCVEGQIQPDGGYCIWGQFETIMDQGKDPNIGPGHIWLTKAKPAGYGTK